MILLMLMSTLAFNIQPIIAEPTSAPIIGGEVRILNLEDDFVELESIDITFSITNRGDPVEFRNQDAHNRIDLEIDFVGKGYGVQIWSTSDQGLRLDLSQVFTKTATYAATSQESYGDVIIRIVHWKYNNVTDGYGYGEFGIHEIRGMFLPSTPVLPIGDINQDGIVNLFDLVKVVIAFGSDPTGSSWNPACDLNGDNTIDILDLAIVAANFGRTT